MLGEGDTLEHRYQLIRLLGKGGMGAVFEAEHTILDKKVAIKLLHPQFSQDSVALERDSLCFENSGRRLVSGDRRGSRRDHPPFSGWRVALEPLRAVGREGGHDE